MQVINGQCPTRFPQGLGASEKPVPTPPSSAGQGSWQQAGKGTRDQPKKVEQLAMLASGPQSPSLSGPSSLESLTCQG